ncbi:PREDICTED: STRUBBELIG-RECEPTOR FAMILY [Prunus dulcis]|uniref:PREDICTED: STRUBBELIG-RECEPTOR FAMILY n=1 Tax=Prunus dulcis TaxID=3755 RepID=A0A5E4FKQ6_PRUDU|nr:PREDICTED: STRUBBELIG-RECEPTOR FAMILY [Prunus dulcis]
MAKQSVWMSFTLTFISAILAFQAVAFTAPSDVTALQDFYEALNSPPQLKGWRLDGGDPCGESWVGVSCSGKLQGLNLSGYLSAQLHNMFNLKTLDVSSNNIVGEIPYVLPPNATHMNLSHNLLSGPVGNVFTGLQNLRELLQYRDYSMIQLIFSGYCTAIRQDIKTDVNF